MIKANGATVIQSNFPDGTLFTRYNAEDDTENFYIEWFYQSDNEIFTLYCLTQHIRRLFDNPKIDLYLPYIPHARMDRVKNDEDVFTLKYFCEILNSLRFDSVTVLDPHSAVSEALINNIIVDNASLYINTAITRCAPDLIFYPDEGAMKRYNGMIKQPYSFGLKKRNWVTGKIEELKIVDNIDAIRNSNILIIDDICSYGGTFYHSAKKLKELGANRIYLYVTHCENSIHDGKLLDDNNLITKIYTTNSIFHDTGLKKFSVFEL